MSPIEHQYRRSGLKFNTTAEQVGNGWYEWSVELDATSPEIESIAEVEYVLHPTFPDRIRRTRSRATKFKLESEGWGEFDIAINVYFKNGAEKTVIVPLKLE